MSLSMRTKVFLGLTRVLEKAGLVPSIEKAASMPLAKRAAGKPPALLVGRRPAGVRTESHTFVARDGHELRVRVYRPTGDGLRPGLVYFHGGGWVLGGLESCDHICARVAADADVVVASVEYRLAPDHRYPAALQDCVDATRWVAEQAEVLGVDVARLGIGGDSAGGNLAAAVALCEVPALVGLVLVYPALDFTYSTPSAREYAGPGVTAAQLVTAGPLYLGGDVDPADPLVSPLLAEDLSHLPPTLVITAEYDPLRDEGRLFAERLQAAGVPVRFTNYVQYLHGFFSLPRLYPGIDQAWNELTGWVRHALHTKV